MPRSKIEKAFQKKVNELVRKAGALEDKEVRSVIRLLADVRKEVASQVASTEWQAYRLPQLKAAVERAMPDIKAAYTVLCTEYREEDSPAA